MTELCSGVPATGDVAAAAELQQVFVAELAAVGRGRRRSREYGYREGEHDHRGLSHGTDHAPPRAWSTLQYRARPADGRLLGG